MSLTILITIIIILTTVLAGADKKAKPQKQPAKPAGNPHGRYPQSHSRKTTVSQSKMQDLSPNSPKNEDYFTYETVEPEILDPTVSDVFSQSNAVENDQQNPENEQQKDSILKWDEDEIKKGIIYSIILKRIDY
jgi:hypothetical protein